LPAGSSRAHRRRLRLATCTCCPITVSRYSGAWPWGDRSRRLRPRSGRTLYTRTGCRSPAGWLPAKGCARSFAPLGDRTCSARAIDRLGLKQAVAIVGSVGLDRMPDVYAAADVVVSVPSSDSSPRSVWEALACGRAVVVSDLQWARDELVDGRHAVLTRLDPI